MANTPYIQDGDEQFTADKETIKLAERALELKARMDSDKKELDNIKKAFLEDYDLEGQTIVVPGSGSIPVSSSETIAIDDHQLLLANCVALGVAFESFATEETKYKPTSEYKKIIGDEEHELHPAFLETASLSYKTNVKILPNK